MSVLGGQPKKHANPSYKATKLIEHTFLISDFLYFFLYLYGLGLDINEKIQSQFCDKIRKLSRNYANFSHKIAALNCVVSGLAKNMTLQYLCVKKPLKRHGE